MNRIFAALLLLPSCQPSVGGPTTSAEDGPVIWTIPVVTGQGGSSMEWQGQTLQLGTGRSWPTDSLAVRAEGDGPQLLVDLGDSEAANWSVYSRALHGTQVLLRIADIDLVVLEMQRDWPAEGVWPLGGDEQAKQRLAELAAVLDD